MRPVRWNEAEQAFEEAWQRRDETAELIDVAHRAARRGRRDEVDVCLAKLYALVPDRTPNLAEELHAICECVRSHPSYDPARAADGPGRPHRRAV
jgi:hypothetical protein